MILFLCQAFEGNNSTDFSDDFFPISLDTDVKDVLRTNLFTFQKYQRDRNSFKMLINQNQHNFGSRSFVKPINQFRRLFGLQFDI